MNTEDHDIRVLALVGSLREGSLNRMLLDAAIELAPQGMDIEVADIGDLPHYAQDLDEAIGGEHEPASAARFRRQAEEADALLFVTPEFNWSIPGVLKNAIDWISRPGGNSPLAHKPAALMGVSGGPAGTGRAQMHLREVLLSTRTPVLMDAVQVPHGRERFDEDGTLVDDGVRAAVSALLETLADAVRAPRFQTVAA